MSYPVKPTGDNILPDDTIFANNNTSKTAMTTSEIQEGYNNDGEAETSLTSVPDANKFNMFWYQVHNTIKWIIAYIEELYNAKLEKSGGTMTGTLNMGTNQIYTTVAPSNAYHLTNKTYVDTKANSLLETTSKSYPTVNVATSNTHNTIKNILTYEQSLYNNKVNKAGDTMTGTLNMGSNKVLSSFTPNADNVLVNKLYVDNLISANAMWLGEIKTMSYTYIPELPEGVEVVYCDGRAISRTDYAEYFSIVGTAYGEGNGTTTFNIPDFRGMFLRGWNTGTTRDRGRVYGTFESNGVPNIKGRTYGEGGGSTDYGCYEGAFYMDDAGTRGAGSSGTDYDNRPVRFNASRSSSVYKDGLTEVRPDNNTVVWIVRIK